MNEKPEDRRTGRSTYLALNCITHAMYAPGTAYHIKDHHGTTEADRFLASMIQDMVHKLGLRGFAIVRGQGPRLYLIYEGVSRVG